MKQTVHKIQMNQNLLSKAGFGNSLTRRFSLTLLTALLSYVGMAQTYTTKAAGNWNSSSTWVGGSMPGTSIGAGKTVIVKHAVTFNQNNDFSISGTLNIEGDTLRFVSSYDKKITVAATGIINVKNGGFLQTISTNKGDMEVNGGRIILENAKFTIGKTFIAKAGTKRTYKNSTVSVGDKYEIEGTSSNRSIDTIKQSILEVAINASDLEMKSYSSLRVDNAKIIVGKGSMKTNANTDVTVLPGAAGNYGIKLLKVDKDVDVNGTWDARIDAFCIGGQVKGSKSADVDFTRPEDCDEDATSAPAPELSFVNPVLIKGTANKQGAEYRFSNITTGVDAVLKLKKFSRSDIKMATVDNSVLGWTKALQPEFGLQGLVLPFQNWYVDFEITFYEAGKNKKVKIQKADFTALDVDGDGYSIAEYAIFSNPANVAFSTVSNLTTQAAGSLGSLLPCPLCLVSSTLIQCNVCQGTGHDDNDLDCTSCDGSGAKHSGCSHPFDGLVGNILQGPTQNYANIDTNGTAVMATYQYQNVDRINFRYGAKSGAYSVNGSGIRLNSLWSKSFNLSPWIALPVSFSRFAVMLDKADVNVNWEAPADEKLSHFLVQRSTDGKTFEDIATVFAGKTAKYSYKDASVKSATGVLYYRVVSVDHTKETMQSGVKMVRLNKSNEQMLTLATYPNPVVSDVRITLPNTWQGKPVMLQLYTANGTIAKSIQLGSANQTETISVGNLTNGLYIVKAVCGEESAQQRIVKN